jgi:hypothetical protein
MFLFKINKIMKKKSHFKSVNLGLIVLLAVLSLTSFGQSNNVPMGSSVGSLWFLDPLGSYSTGTSGYQLHVDGDILFTSSQFNSNRIRFHSPNTESGFTLETNSSGTSRADIRYDGTTLKLVTNSSGSVPPNQNGLAIDNFGFVGFGNNTPYARIHLSDPNNSNYGAYFNSNSTGPTLYVKHNSSGNTNPTTYIGLVEHPALVVENSYNPSSTSSFTTGAYIKARNVGTYSMAYGEVNNDFSTGLHAGAFNGGAGLKNMISYGVFSTAYNGNTSYGIWSYGESDVDANGTAYGVYGTGNCTSSSGSAVAYGVYGDATGGAINWAGYFNGDVFANGAYFASDKKLKRDITEINNSLQIIAQLNPSKYYYTNNQDYSELNLPKGLRYGLIAQEVESVLPELTKLVKNPEIRNNKGEVVKPASEFLSVDYVSIIPLLIGSIKDQQKQIEELKSELKLLKQNELTGNESNQLEQKLNPNESALFQNSPNPSSESTSIKYLLGVNAKSASILIFDLSGKLLKTFVLEVKSNSGELLIPQGTLPAGMFVYSLIVDNKVIDTKRMVLNN